MKKIIISLLVLILIPFMVNAKGCEPDKITIQSVTINNKTENVSEKTIPSIKDKTINIGLNMSEVGDSIEYRMIVKNDSNEDYLLDKRTISNNSDYIDYTLETRDKTNIIKAKDQKEVYLRVEYKNKVASNLFENGVYNDNKNLKVNLSTDDSNNILNPKTGISLIVIILLLIGIGAIIYLFIKIKKPSKVLLFIIGMTLVIPLGVYAICKFDITVDSSVTIKIEEGYFKIREKQCDASYEKEGIFLYEKGMTFDDFINSEYYTNLDDEKKKLVKELLKIYDENIDYSLYNSYREDKNIIACIDEIEVPSWYPGMTSEEEDLAYEQYNIKVKQCYTENRKRIEINDKIDDQDKATYVPDFEEKSSCPN